MMNINKKLERALFVKIWRGAGWILIGLGGFGALPMEKCIFSVFASFCCSFRATGIHF